MPARSLNTEILSDRQKISKKLACGGHIAFFWSERTYERDNNFGLHRVQTKELYYQEEPQDHDGKTGAFQVLQVLQEAHEPQRNKVAVPGRHHNLVSSVFSG